MKAEVAALKEELAREKETVQVTTDRLKEMEGGETDGRDRSSSSFLFWMALGSTAGWANRPRLPLWEIFFTVERQPTLAQIVS